MNGESDKYSCRHCGHVYITKSHPVQCKAYGCNSISFDIWVVPEGGHKLENESIKWHEIRWGKAINALGFNKQPLSKRISKWFAIFWHCRIWTYHDWTCAAIEGKKPTAEQLKSIEGFFDYAKMYCKRCGHMSGRNKKL